MIYSYNDILNIIEEDKNEKFLSEIRIIFNKFDFDNKYDNYNEVEIIINKCVNGGNTTVLGVKTNYYDFIDKIERIFKIDNHQIETTRIK